MKRHVEIFEHLLPGGGKLVVLRGIFQATDTREMIRAYMDGCVSQCVKDKPYNSFIEENEANTCLRVIIFGINKLPFETITDWPEQ